MKRDENIIGDVELFNQKLVPFNAIFVEHQFRIQAEFSHIDESKILAIHMGVFFMGVFERERNTRESELMSFMTGYMEIMEVDSTNVDRELIVALGKSYFPNLVESQDTGFKKQEGVEKFSTFMVDKFFLDINDFPYQSATTYPKGIIQKLRICRDFIGLSNCRGSKFFVQLICQLMVILQIDVDLSEKPFQTLMVDIEEHYYKVRGINESFKTYPQESYNLIFKRKVNWQKSFSMSNFSNYRIDYEPLLKEPLQMPFFWDLFVCPLKKKELKKHLNSQNYNIIDAWKTFIATRKDSFRANSREYFCLKETSQVNESTKYWNFFVLVDFISIFERGSTPCDYSRYFQMFHLCFSEDCEYPISLIEKFGVMSDFSRNEFEKGDPLGVLFWDDYQDFFFMDNFKMECPNPFIWTWSDQFCEKRNFENHRKPPGSSFFGAEMTVVDSLLGYAPEKTLWRYNIAYLFGCLIYGKKTLSISEAKKIVESAMETFF